MSTTYQTFPHFWDAISKSFSSRNHPTFHPCCNSWTTRLRNRTNIKHASSVKWKQLFSHKDAKETSQQEYLQAHMREHGWGLPIRVNHPCSALPDLNQALEKSDSPPPPQAFPGAFQFHVQLAAPTSVHSTPAQLHDLPPETQALVSGAQVPPQLHLETESRNLNARYSSSDSSLERSLQALQACQDQMVEEIKSINRTFSQSLLKMQVEQAEIKWKQALFLDAFNRLCEEIGKMSFSNKLIQYSFNVLSEKDLSPQEPETPALPVPVNSCSAQQQSAQVPNTTARTQTQEHRQARASNQPQALVQSRPKAKEVYIRWGLEKKPATQTLGQQSFKSSNPSSVSAKPSAGGRTESERQQRVREMFDESQAFKSSMMQSLNGLGRFKKDGPS